MKICLHEILMFKQHCHQMKICMNPLNFDHRFVGASIYYSIRIDFREMIQIQVGNVALGSNLPNLRTPLPLLSVCFLLSVNFLVKLLFLRF